MSPAVVSLTRPPPTARPHARDDLSTLDQSSAACISLTRSSSCSVTAGSRSVVTSPSARPSAMSRRSLRMILPERVLGRSSAHMMRSGRANLPMRWRRSRGCPRPLLVAGQIALQGDEGDDRLSGVLRRAGRSRRPRRRRRGRRWRSSEWNVIVTGWCGTAFKTSAGRKEVLLRECDWLWYEVVIC